MERRKINFTDEERTILMDLMDRHRDVLECKKTDAVSIHAKKKTWEKLADEFNSNHNVRPRTSKQLKKCWDNLKEKWRRAKAEDTRQLFKTGGGTPAESQMSDELRRVGAVASHMATRLANPFDSDRTGPGVEATPAVAALLASSQPGRSTDADVEWLGPPNLCVPDVRGIQMPTCSVTTCGNGSCHTPKMKWPWTIKRHKVVKLLGHLAVTIKQLSQHHPQLQLRQLKFCQLLWHRCHQPAVKGD
ncbi:hypothetical protein HPB49_004150 [Dermacentor silvarum]|uniref:Uncharacterized protein n=1 Tax=Dermacentor silvarum TaxID=543639 RepID=A0ACB8DUM1_DERSI|nr:hypothetical protein HPB49_004150 [Dermacentor silvarum]